MSEANSNFKTTIDSLFKGMDNFLTTKTVVGEAIHVGDTIILPLAEVTFGVCATAKTENTKNNGGGGMGGKMVPSAILVIKDGSTRLVNIKNQDGVAKVIDMVPDLVNRFAAGDFNFGRKSADTTTAEEEKAVKDASEEVVFE